MYRALFLAATLMAAAMAHATIGLIVGEPFGSFGTMLPAGHASIYLDFACAASPTTLRPCGPGEPGVVVSRYHDLKTQKLDWLVFPATTFFYGVPETTQVPAYITPTLRDELRENYRRQYLQALFPDHTDKHGNLRAAPEGDWQEGIGAAFDRRLYLYTLDTTPAQQQAILDWLATDPNHRHYKLWGANCADFAEHLLDMVLSNPIQHNRLGDLGIQSPKQLALQIDAYGRTHPERNLQVFEIPQIPGTLRRSRPVRGGTETFIKTKRYFATLLVLQPEILAADLVVYETRDKGTVGRDAKPILPAAFSTPPAPAIANLNANPQPAPTSLAPAWPSPDAPAESDFH